MLNLRGNVIDTFVETSCGGWRVDGEMAIQCHAAPVEN